jgi:hypothetical protein
MDLPHNLKKLKAIILIPRFLPDSHRTHSHLRLPAPASDLADIPAYFGQMGRLARALIGGSVENTFSVKHLRSSRPGEEDI